MIIANMRIPTMPRLRFPAARDAIGNAVPPAREPAAGPGDQRGHEYSNSCERRWWFCRRPQSRGVPRIEDGDAKTGEILYVPRHNYQIVLQRRGCDHAIRHV